MLVDAAPAGGEAERADGVFAKPRIDFLCAMTSFAMFRIIGSNRGAAPIGLKRTAPRLDAAARCSPKCNPSFAADFVSQSNG